jgi:hypothetical protein
MVLYTVFAWTAVVIAGGVYYWVYVRQEPLPGRFLGISSAARDAAASSASSSQKRKRKSGASKRQGAEGQANESLVATTTIHDATGDETLAPSQRETAGTSAIAGKGLKGTQSTRI